MGITWTFGVQCVGVCIVGETSYLGYFGIRVTVSKLLCYKLCSSLCGWWCRGYYYIIYLMWLSPNNAGSFIQTSRGAFELGQQWIITGSYYDRHGETTGRDTHISGRGGGLRLQGTRDLNVTNCM